MLALKTWAVIGSTHNPDKFAYKVYKKLKDRAYNVYSINPGGHCVDGDISYVALSDVPVIPDVIDMVINPVAGEQIIADAIKLGIKNIWFQPGAETSKLVDMAQNAGINVVYNRCVLVELQ